MKICLIIIITRKAINISFRAVGSSSVIENYQRSLVIFPYNGIVAALGLARLSHSISLVIYEIDSFFMYFLLANQ
jgi:hypothetical protein